MFWTCATHSSLITLLIDTCIVLYVDLVLRTYYLAELPKWLSVILVLRQSSITAPLARYYEAKKMHKTHCILHHCVGTKPRYLAHAKFCLMLAKFCHCPDYIYHYAASMSSLQHREFTFFLV